MEQKIFQKISEEYDKGKLNFIKFILTTYKLENKDIKYKDFEDSYLEKSFPKKIRELIKYYHPDNFSKKTLKEKEKYIIYHEITSKLNLMYSTYKC